MNNPCHIEQFSLDTSANFEQKNYFTRTLTLTEFWSLQL